MGKTTTRTAGASESTEPNGPAPAPTAEVEPGPPEVFGPGVPVHTIWWAKDAAPQLPGLSGGGWSRTEAWPQAMAAPAYRILFLPKVRLFWVRWLGAVEKNDRGLEGNRERFIPLEHSTTWTAWRGDEDIPRGAWTRMQLLLMQDVQDAS